MSNNQLIQASLKDVIPTYSGDFPPQLLTYVNSLYQLSLLKMPRLPNLAEVARYHLCAYLAVERCQEHLELPNPLQQKIPVQPKLVERLLDDLQEKLVSSPSSSPRKRVLTPTSSPSKKQNVPKLSSPLKKQRLAAEESDENASLPVQSKPTDEDSPFVLKAAVESPFMTKLTNAADSTPQAPSSPLKTPRKSIKSTVSTPNSPRYLRHLTIADFISFANNFYIPATVTPQIVECFMLQKHKFTKKNEWLLACGLIYAAYTRINHRLIESTIGKRTELQDQLFQYQKGGLMKWNMVTWLSIIEESVKAEPWIVDLEMKFVHNNWTAEDTTKEKEIVAKLGRGYELLLTFGSMINPSTMFDKESQQLYYDTWTERLLEEVD